MSETEAKESISLDEVKKAALRDLSAGLRRPPYRVTEQQLEDEIRQRHRFSI
jgi:hypothetical protein